MNSEYRFQPFLIKNTQKNLARLGCALQRDQGSFDLYFLKEPAELEPQGLKRVIEAYIPALLGVLELHALQCGDIDQSRGDNAVAIQSVTTAALDTLLRQKGKSGAQASIQEQFSQFTGSQTGRQALHQIHHAESADAWRKTLRPTVTVLGGVGEIEVRTISRATLEKRDDLTWLPREWEIERSSENLLVVKGFRDQVEPRLGAAGASKEVIAQRILEITHEDSPIPLSQQLSRVGGLREKISFTGLPWNKSR